VSILCYDIIKDTTQWSENHFFLPERQVNELFKKDEDLIIKFDAQSDDLNLNLLDLLIEDGCATLLSFECNFLAHSEYHTTTN